MAYITKRFDREIRGDRVRLHAMEDFCQLSNRLTQDKYKGSYESCGKIISKYSDHPGLDLSELFLRVAFSFIIMAIVLAQHRLKGQWPGNMTIFDQSSASEKTCG